MKGQHLKKSKAQRWRHHDQAVVSIFDFQAGRLSAKTPPPAAQPSASKEQTGGQKRARGVSQDDMPAAKRVATGAELL